MGITKENAAIYQETLDKWGHDAQLNMVIEKLGELIVAVQHARRLEKWDKVASVEQIIEEIADVEIMCEQLRYMFNIGSIRLFQIKEKKLARVKELLQQN